LAAEPPEESAAIRRERYLDRVAELLQLAARAVDEPDRREFMLLALYYERMASWPQVA